MEPLGGLEAQLGTESEGGLSSAEGELWPTCGRGVSSSVGLGLGGPAAPWEPAAPWIGGQDKLGSRLGRA